MKIHHFTKSVVRGSCEVPRERIINMDGLSLADFQKIHGGGFCELPGNWYPPKPGFVPYRLGSGEVVGVRDE